MKDYNRNIKQVNVFFLFCFVMVISALAYKMVITGDETARKPFYDEKFIELMNRIIEDEAVYEEDGKINVSQDRLDTMIKSRRLKQRVMRSLDYIIIDHGRLVFDRSVVKIVNRRLEEEGENIIRGRFLDRNEVVLAETTVGRKTGRTKRIYPFGPEYFHIIGYSNRVYKNRFLEKTLNDYLLGINRKSVFRRVYDFLQLYKVGDDVMLTIDSKIQHAAFEVLGERRGAVVALKVDTGEVLACVSLPSFDPNATPGKKWIVAERDRELKPFINRAISATYPPGSSFKVIDTASWLEWDEKEKNYKVTCKGYNWRYRIRDHVKHGVVDLKKALADSCNVFFAGIGVKMGERLYDYAGLFGFNRGFDLIPQDENLSFPVEPSLAFSWYQYTDLTNPETGNIVTERIIKSYNSHDFRVNPKVVAQCAIGQNLVSATPLQMAMVASVIANDGVLENPYIVKAIKFGQDPEEEGEVGWSYRRFHPQEVARAIEKKTARKTRDLMVEVLKSGTGKKLKKIYRDDTGKFISSSSEMKGKLIQVAGKTGTAEVGDKNNNGKKDEDEKEHSWFICFAPANDPEVAVAVMAENAGWGSRVAGPIAIEVLTASLNALNN